MSHRRIFLFQPRFVELVEAGAKTHTIRAERADGLRVAMGDMLDLRTCTGKPYRSKQRKLIERKCTAVRRVKIWETREKWYVKLDGVLLVHAEIRGLAIDDGFEGGPEMFAWFTAVHGLPFIGWLIEWEAKA